MGGKHGASKPTPATLTSLHVLTDPKVLRSLASWVFMEASLHKRDSLNYWPLANDPASSLSLLPEGQGDGTVGSNPLLLW